MRNSPPGENKIWVAKSDITQWTKSLENVTFQAELGSQAARINGLPELAAELAPIVGADADQAPSGQNRQG